MAIPRSHPVSYAPLNLEPSLISYIHLFHCTLMLLISGARAYDTVME